MINQLSQLNWVSVFIAFAAYFVLGYVWYTLLFSKQYKTSLGRENETLPAKPIFIIGPAICTLVYVITSAVLIYTLNIRTIEQVLEFTGIAGMGYLVSNTFNIAINPNIPRPVYYSIITGSYHLVGITIASLILVWMR